MKNIILARVLDAVVISLLLVDHSSANRFAATVAVFLSIVMLIAFFAMSADLANKIKARSLFSRAFGMMAQASYVGALIYAGYPSIAAFYALAAVLLRACVHQKLKPAGEEV
ncbi:hypothetical protein [Pseudomonas sp. zfem002]|uniref:hypothetical protein n=1 Tax=Pseudomonas sp. zfem002 TaxID=3078197 RepID=UPI002927F65C|nr:hypothetical protein [Pseudomonas sp. zfem002]MDU9393733.1 hypothetical protein [Pseudomonas sp. zfem002]